VDDELVVAVGVPGQDYLGRAGRPDPGQQSHQVLGMAAGDRVVHQVPGPAALDEGGGAVAVLGAEPQRPVALDALLHGRLDWRLAVSGLVAAVLPALLCALGLAQEVRVLVVPEVEQRRVDPDDKQPAG